VYIWYVKSLTRPLEKLQAAAAQIEDGNYRIELSNPSRDETGILTRSVESMANVLSNFEMLTNKNISRLARQGKLSLGGAKHEAAVFFSDIRGFTGISRKMSAPEVVSFINDYMDYMVSCVTATGGVIDKFIGDAVFAHWGAVGDEMTPEESAHRSIETALLMRAALACFNHDNKAFDIPDVHIGCAINCGEVISGQIGSDERMEFTIIGDAVGLADRVEGLNKIFNTEILITDYTRQLAGDDFIYEEVPPLFDANGMTRIFTVVNAATEEEEDRLSNMLENQVWVNMEICPKYIGPGGPHSLDEIRHLMNLPTPDLSDIDTSTIERKYRVVV
jgi:adenylate cyclase